MHQFRFGLVRVMAAASIALLAAPVAVAQDLAADRAAQIAAAAHLQAGQTVRLALPGVGRVTGTMALDSSGHLMFQEANGPSPLGFGVADTLWLRKRAWLPGMVIGGVVGAGFAALVMAAACETDCLFPSTAVSFSVLSVAIGAAVGAGIGALIPKWKRAWIR